MTPAMILVSAMKDFNTMIIDSLNEPLDLLVGSAQFRHHNLHANLQQGARIVTSSLQGHNRTP